ncbi:hypothetical protein BDZ89DRAFT_1070549 [Hymenopellis radicata]|nr:hypothetical protein BDZ89DRAFT_1070549 [Hymenopellis radicata]
MATVDFMALIRRLPELVRDQLQVRVRGRHSLQIRVSPVSTYSLLMHLKHANAGLLDLGGRFLSQPEDLLVVWVTRVPHSIWYFQN